MTSTEENAQLSQAWHVCFIYLFRWLDGCSWCHSLSNKTLLTPWALPEKQHTWTLYSSNKRCVCPCSLLFLYVEIQVFALKKEDIGGVREADFHILHFSLTTHVCVRLQDFIRKARKLLIFSFCQNSFDGVNVEGNKWWMRYISGKLHCFKYIIFMKCAA